MCPPRAVTQMATWLDASAASVGMAVDELGLEMHANSSQWEKSLPSSGWNGSSAALKHSNGTEILCNLLCNVATL